MNGTVRVQTQPFSAQCAVDLVGSTEIMTVVCVFAL
jgi:hypothetical protein